MRSSLNDTFHSYTPTYPGYHPQIDEQKGEVAHEGEQSQTWPSEVVQVLPVGLQIMPKGESEGQVPQPGQARQASSTT